MNDFQWRCTVYVYIGGGALADARLAARQAQIHRFAFAGTEWYLYRNQWRHD